ncbi:MAG TPA: alpha/beta fold hydrolase [Pyrinomonadaceae bacterium]|jgi:pimeloyl-ACP methyl ester carboxylesterase|nr:alpha/beta fold hydrolase [Pyrinomonadaceae bacterium]
MGDDLTNTDPRIRHGSAQVGDVRLHYAESGAADRPLVLLLHGFPEFWYSWRHQLVALGEHFHTVAPDLRGYNLSDKPQRAEDYRVEKLMDDVTGLIRHFGARRAAVVGHDWGAVVAWALAQFFPDYVSKLAALQVPPGAVWAANMTWRQALASWYMLFFQLPRLPEWWIGANNFAGLERMFKTTSRSGTFTDSDIALYKEMLKRRGASGETTALSAGINYYRANFSLLTRNFSSIFGRGEGVSARVRVPTLFVYGERDAFVMPETVRGVGAYVDAPFREVRLARAGHWVQQEYPNEVSAALLGFLSE